VFISGAGEQVILVLNRERERECVCVCVCVCVHDSRPTISASSLQPQTLCSLWSIRWGFRLASKAAGRGRGSRSLLHHAQRGLVMHDASYWACLCLRGQQQEICTALGRVR
jgi:hypothetical protein